MSDTQTTAGAPEAILREILPPFPVAAQEHLHIDDSAIKRIGALTAAAAAIHQKDEAFYLVTPGDYAHKNITTEIEAARRAPNRKRGTVRLGEIKSFNEYVTAQAHPTDAYIYADPEARTLTAVLNDHEQDDNMAGWRDFRAVYTAELSREFANWMKFNKEPMDQETFAVFLEDNIADIVEPSGESLMAVALTLQAKTEVNFSSHRRLDNGQIQLAYAESITATAGGSGNIEIPREFAIGVRLFKNGEGYKVKARLKYRLGAGKVKFWYELDRPENVIEDAFNAYIAVARESGFVLLIGKP
jgi:uncharacterized protein YfdQ (DUF2303 family)